ncbi:MAG TPA: hypothetical protein VF956_04180 [Candidatus Dormibacteraeota bacterium]
MGVRALSGLAFAVVAILLAPAAAVAATDLHPLLAAPPSADWIADQSSATNLVGDFTAHDYAAYAGPGGAGIEFDLNLYGFTRGFALEWAQRGSQNSLAERVFEFRDARGARSWFTLLRLTDRTSGPVTRDIPTPSVPNSYGALFTLPDGTLQSWIEFWKGNVAFVVITDSAKDDLSATAVTQAATEYSNAPTHTDVPPGAGQTVNDWLRNIGFAAGALVLAVAIVVTVTIVLITRRRRPAALLAGGPALPAGGPMMSADGAYWWDGQRWRDASVEAPATAPRSPDGALWWDGRSWRPLPVPRPPGS